MGSRYILLTLFSTTVLTACPSSPPPAVDQGVPPPPDAAIPKDSEPTPAPVVIEPGVPEDPKVQFSDFVGAERCGECHQAAYEKWSESTHGRAGGAPTEARLLPPGKHRTFEFSDARIELVREGTQYAFWVTNLDAARDAPKQKLSIDGVVGAEAMLGGGAQAYFHRTPLGTVVHLPFEYSHRARRWYCQRREESGGRVEHRWRPIDGQFPLADCGWPPKTTLGYSNYTHCGNCHGSQIEVVFDAAAKQIRTQWTALHINCESCHGPGRRHVELMEAPTETHTADIGLPALDLADKHASTRVCLACHASKRSLSAGYLSGDRVEDYFTTSNMDLEAHRNHHPDGRIADFGYQEGHLHSDCFQGGAMTCVDCHDPHAQTYRDPHGRPLVGRFDDGQCTGCHSAKKGDHAHSGHTESRQAPRCTDCHMPFTQHPAVPESFRIARSDHVIPIPRPGFDDELGVKNACAHCHSAKGIGWQMAETKRLFGDLKPHAKAVSALKDVRSGRRTATEWVLDLGARPGPNAIIALTLFLHERLEAGEDGSTARSIAAVEALLDTPSTDLRAAAMATLLVLGQDRPQSLQKVQTAIGPKPALTLHRRIKKHLLELYTSLGTRNPGRMSQIERALDAYLEWTRDDGASAIVARANAAVERGDLTLAGRLFLDAADIFLSMTLRSK